MKSKSALIVVASLVVLSALMMTGCGYIGKYDVDNAKRTVVIGGHTYYTKDELVDEDLKEPTKTEIGGKTYWYDAADKPETIKKSKLAKKGIVLNKDKFILYAVGDGDYNQEYFESVFSLFDFSKLAIQFTKKPITSNATIKDNVIKVKRYKCKPVYATFTKAAAKCKKVKATIKNGSKTSKKTVYFKTRGVITSIKVNGKKYTPDVVLKKGKLKRDYVTFKKAGKYNIKVKLSSGHTKTFRYTYVK